MSEDNSEKFIEAVPTTFDITTENIGVAGPIYASPDVTADEAREHVAERFGIDPAEVNITSAEDQSSSGRNKSFGFSNWAGSTWEPKGPKGNPNLN